MRHKRLGKAGVIAAWALLSGAVAGHAQAGAPGLTLGDVYRQLMTASPALEAARARAAAAEARVAPARTLPDPQLQFSLMNRAVPGFGFSDPLGMNQIQLMEMIPFPGKLGAAGRTARAQAGAAGARAEEVRWELRNRAAMAFYDIYAVERSILVAEETRQLLRDIATTAQTMYAVAEGRQPDVLRARIEVDRMTEEILRMETMRETMAARLNAVLNQPAETPVPAARRPAFPAALPDLDSLIARALAQRPMLAAGKQEVLAADGAYSLARREIWPDLQVGVAYGWRPMPEGGTDRMASVMLGVSLPVFAASRQLKMRQEARAMQEMARADLAAMEAETRGRVATAYAELRQARRLRELYRTTLLPEASATVASSLAAYRVGDVNLMTLLDAQMTVNRYRQELLQLEAAEGKAWAELEMLLGQELVDPDRVQDALAESR
ncbi:MAG TPA: TolC family protein [Gemmatimonadales bacterium]|nr:TolC family protein [Gemmatimonadales bacterium]